MGCIPHRFARVHSSDSHRILPTVHSALRNSHAIRSHDVVSSRREAARHSTKDGLPLTYNRLVAMPLLFRFLLRDSLAARHPTPRLFLSADWAKNLPDVMSSLLSAMNAAERRMKQVPDGPNPWPAWRGFLGCPRRVTCFARSRGVGAAEGFLSREYWGRYLRVWHMRVIGLHTRFDDGILLGRAVASETRIARRRMG